MATTEYTVTGMTCGHCVSSVQTEVGKLAGVGGVQIDLASGTLRVEHSDPVAPADVISAVDEAGYQAAVK